MAGGGTYASFLFGFSGTTADSLATFLEGDDCGSAAVTAAAVVVVGFALMLFGGEEELGGGKKDSADAGTLRLVARLDSCVRIKRK
jgi:hypothetical protein